MSYRICDAFRQCDTIVHPTSGACLMTDVAMLLTGFAGLIVAVGALVVSVGVLYLVVKLGSAIESMSRNNDN